MRRPRKRRSKGGSPRLPVRAYNRGLNQGQLQRSLAPGSAGGLDWFNLSRNRPPAEPGAFIFEHFNMSKRYRTEASLLAVCGLLLTVAVSGVRGDSKPADNAAKSQAASAEPNVNWSQWGGSPARNNTPVGKDIPTEWN